MKQFLVQLDDRLARELERVAPTKSRKRAEFVRLAIRHAVDLALDRTTTETAYARAPLAGALLPADLAGWDEQNELARPPAKTDRSKRARKKAA